MQILDLTAADQPRPVGHLHLYGEPKALAKYQQYVYLAADTSGVQIFDVSDPQTPLLGGYQRLPGQASAIAITGGQAYIGTRQHGLYLYDLVNPRRPSLLAHLPLEMPIVHLAATATHVYVAGFDAGVAIIDITTPTLPRLLTTIPAGSHGDTTLGVAVHQQRLYVAAHALTVFDVQDPAQPHRLAQVPLLARLVRSSFLAEKNKEYVEASHIVGESNLYIAFRQILPNCLSPIIVQASVSIGFLVIVEAALAFLELGAQPPTPAWGTDLNEAKNFMETYPLLTIFPGVALSITVLGFNLFGDGLRDILDPRQVEQ